MRSAQSIRIRVQAVVGLLVAVLAIVCALSAGRAYQRREDAQRVLAVTDASRILFAAMNNMRLERGATNNRLLQAAPQTDRDIAFRRELRARDNIQLDVALAKLDALAAQGGGLGQDRIRARRLAVQALRATTDAALQQPLAHRPRDLAPRWMAASTALTDALDETGGRLAAAVGRDDPFVVRMMTIGQLAWSARDSAGTDMLLLGQEGALAQPLTAAQRAQHSNLAGRTDTPWAMLQVSARTHGAPTALRAAIDGASLAFFTRERAMRAAILDALTAGRPSPYSLDEERVIDTAGLSSLMGVAATAFDLAASRAASEADAAQRQFYAAIAVMLIAVGCGLAASFYVTARLLSPIGQVTAAMRAVADGDLEAAVPGADRPDEVGELARALGVFRANAVAKRKADEELLASRVAREAAEASAKAQAEFLANMSHEIRTPLTGVIGFAGLMARMTDLPAQARAHLQKITTGGQALLSLVNDILDFSRIEAGQVELDPRTFDPAALLADAIELVRPEAEAKGLALSLNIAGPMPERVVADEDRVRQVLLNLIGNAIKFTGEGAVRVEAFFRPMEQRLLVRIRDTGAGFSAEQGERLFQRFSQIDASNTRRHGGAGLGLAISKGLVEMMGGEIGFESEPGRGSLFWFEVAAPVAATAPEVSAPEAEPGDLSPLRILVVDDVAVNRELVSALLSPFEADLSEAANGAEAVAAANSQGFDLILMDLQMPVMDGLAATRAIRASSSFNAATPILAVSANVMAPQVEACMAAGMNDHIAKPIDPADLFRKIGRWVDATKTAA